MSPAKVRQLRLPFHRESFWDQLPVENRRRAQELLDRLLRTVVTGERKQGSVSDEQRKDQSGTS